MKKLFLLVMASLIASSAALAERLPFPPPAQFDKPYAGKLTVQYVNPAEVNGVCRGGQAAGPFMQACTFVIPDRGECKIIMPKDTGVYSKQYLAALLKHENGHCNGWVH